MLYKYIHTYTMSSKSITSQNNMRELLNMGAFDLYTNDPIKVTRSSRRSVAPARFSDATFIPGSGWAIRGEGYDATERW